MTSQIFRKLYAFLRESTARARPDSQVRLHIAGQTLKLRLFSDELARSFLPALSHLETRNPGPSRVTLNICGGISMTPDWDPAAAVRRAAGPGPATYFYSRGPLKAALSASENAFTASFYDAGRRTGYFWTPGPAALPFHEKGHPCRDLMHWYLQSRGLAMVHAGAVGTARAAVLIGGPSGSGKSTVSLACWKDRMAFFGDDYVAVGLDPAPRVHSLYGTAKLDGPALRRTGLGKTDRKKAVPFGGGKQLFFLHGLRAQHAPLSRPLKALVLTSVGNDGPAKIMRTSAAEAVRRLAPSTLLQLPGSCAGDFALLRRIAERLPCYLLTVGRRLDGAARLIEDLANSGGPREE